MLSTVRLSQVNKGTSSLTIMLFLFLFLASVDVATQDSDAVKKESGSIPEETSKSDLANQDSSDTGSDETIDNAVMREDEESPEIESEDISDSETNESATTLSENMSNLTSTPNPESITMTPSDLSPNNQTSNQTEADANKMLTLQEKLSKGIITDNTIFTPRIYQVTVIFDSITVHEDHEGLLSGDGEYMLYAFVQGNVVDLTDASIPGDPYHYPGEIPGLGLGDVSEGETVQFVKDTRVTVDLPETTPLSIFTVGKELDGCDFYQRENPFRLPKDLIEIFKNPQLDWLTPITQYIKFRNSDDCISPHDSEVLGNIVKFYNPPGQSYEPIGYGAGAHTNVVSSKGDYTLRYTIAVTPPPPPPTASQKKLEPGSMTNQFQSNNTGIFNK